MKYSLEQIVSRPKSTGPQWAEDMFNLRMNLGKGNNIEIGVLAGGTTIPMATALVNTDPDSKHFAIDPWGDGSVYGKRVVNLGWIPKNNAGWGNALADESSAINVPEDQRVPILKGSGDDAFKLFLLRMEEFDPNLLDYVHIIRAYSTEITEETIKSMFPAAMLFIDGGHTRQAVYRDIMSYHQCVRVGGVMAFDDWGGFGVTEGYEDAVPNLVGKWSSPEQFAHSRVFIKREE